MKNLFILVSTLSLVVLASCSGNGSIETTSSLSSSKDSLSYVIGYSLGLNVKSASIPVADLDIKVVAEALNAAINDKESALIEQQIQEIMSHYFTILLPEKLKQRNLAELEQVKKDNPNAKITPSGLIYEIVAAGDTTIKVTQSDTATINYTGKFLNGKQFDSSYDRGAPAVFAPLEGSIIGFREAASLVGPGGEVKVWIPSELAYGPNPSGPIPPSSNLYFEIKVESVKKAKQ